jgi:rare lipoprotein A
VLTLCAIVSMPPKANALTGLASWYDIEGHTASGEYVSGGSWTAAHKTFQFGSELTVCYGNTCVHNVRVIDRGPYTGGRDLDLHVAPAAELGLTTVGVDYVRYRREIPGHWDGVYVTPAGSGKWIYY